MSKRANADYRDFDEMDGGYNAGLNCRVWVAVGVAAVSAVYGGVMASKGASKQAAASRVAGMGAQTEGALDEQMNYMAAADTMKSAQKEADNIKRSALVLRGTMTVAQSGSGVMIGEGSAQAAVDQLDTLSSADALAALFGAVNTAAAKRAGGRFAATAGSNKDKAMMQAASDQTAAGNAALTGGLLKAGAGVAGGAYSSYSAPKGNTVNSSTPMDYSSGNYGTPQAGV